MCGVWREALLSMLYASCWQDEVLIYPAQVVDQDLYKLSVQLFRQDREHRRSSNVGASVTPVTLPLPTATAVHWLVHCKMGFRSPTISLPPCFCLMETLCQNPICNCLTLLRRIFLIEHVGFCTLVDKPIWCHRHLESRIEYLEKSGNLLQFKHRALLEG